MKYTLFTVFAALAFVSCKKETPDPVVAVSPDQINIVATEGEVLSFDISVTSEETLDKFTITSKTSTGFTQTEFEEDLSTQTSYSHDFEYMVSAEQVDQDILFTFTATTQSGLEGAAARRVYVEAEQSTALSETTGHVIYSNFSGKHNGFNLGSLSANMVASSEAEDIHIADYDTLSTDSAMIPAWYSPAGAKFARFNDFNYAAATAESAALAFSTGTQHDVLTDLEDGDIVLVQFGTDSAIAVVRVEQIFQGAGVANDRYNFSVKK